MNDPLWQIGDIVSVQDDGNETGFGLKIEALDGTTPWTHPVSGDPVEVNPRFMILEVTNATLAEVQEWMAPPDLQPGQNDFEKTGSRIELDPDEADPQERARVVLLNLARRGIFSRVQADRLRFVRDGGGS